MKTAVERAVLIRWGVTAGVALAIAALLYRVGIVPLQRRERAQVEQAAELRGRIAAARQSIQEIKQQEQAAAGVRGSLRQMQRDLPSGSVLAWFPSRMKQHFDSVGVANSVTRLNTEQDEPGIVGYQRTYWAVDLPLSESVRAINNVLIGVASLEEAEPVVKVMDLAIRRDDETTPGIAVINVTALVEK